MSPGDVMEPVGALERLVWGQSRPHPISAMQVLIVGDYGAVLANSLRACAAQGLTAFMGGGLFL